MKYNEGKIIFDSREEMSDYDYLVHHIKSFYKTETEMKKLIKTIKWFINSKHGTEWFQGFCFDTQRVLNCLPDGKYNKMYERYINNYDDIWNKKINDNIVSWSIRSAWIDIINYMSWTGLLKRVNI